MKAISPDLREKPRSQIAIKGVSVIILKNKQR